MDRHQELTTKLLAMATAGADEQDLKACANEAKAALWAENVSLWRALGLIDALINLYAFDPTWKWGFTEWQQQPLVATATPTPAVVSRPSRQGRTVEIAQQLIRQGASRVSTAEIAQTLSNEGDPTAIKNLIVSVGNTLNRSGWRRIAPGEYAPNEEGRDTTN